MNEEVVAEVYAHVGGERSVSSEEHEIACGEIVFFNFGAHLLETEHLVVEGAGAVGVAAVLARKVDGALRVPVVLVTGANVDLATLLATVEQDR